MSSAPDRPTWQQHAKQLEQERDAALEERDQSRLGELHAGEAVEELKAAILKALGWLDVGLVWNARVVLQKALAPVGTDIAEKKS